jgi:hypothetical protein
MANQVTNPRKMIKAPNSLHELREQLCQMYADVSNDRAMVPQADSASNVAGKIINITKLEIEASRIAGHKNNNKFLLGLDASEKEEATHAQR